ncbi:MAG: (2Fe-2S)-binding protein [Dehalococcoidia bacterium]|nr:(2Fe-2S)-binding protein [Dehalococcoidia bacterium]
MTCILIIDGREVKAVRGANLLWTALDNGFYIPNLCAIRGLPRSPASCRLCFVEIAGRPGGPVTACTEKVFDGMSVTLNSPIIKRMRQTSFNLLLSNHALDCARCVKNKKCELQNIAVREHFKLKDRRFNNIPLEYPIDYSHPLIIFDRNKCVLCGKCVHACNESGTSVLDFTYRGLKTSVSTFAEMPLAETACNSCLACAAVCPVGSIYLRSLLPGIPAD